MIRNSLLTVLLISGLFISAGCIRGNPGNYDDIYYTGSLKASDQGFSMNGSVSIGGGAAAHHVYRDVTLNLYTESGELIYSTELGELSQSEPSLPVSITHDKVPHYVTFESPDFWRDDVQVEYYKSNQNGEYVVFTATSKGDLPPYDG